MALRRENNQAEYPQSSDNPYRCRWETQGQRCKMTGTIGHIDNDRVDLLCGWHHGLDYKKNTLDEFEEFLGRYWPERNTPLPPDVTENQKARYKNSWIRLPLMDLWEKVSGRGVG